MIVDDNSVGFGVSNPARFHSRLEGDNVGGNTLCLTPLLIDFAESGGGILQLSRVKAKAKLQSLSSLDRLSREGEVARPFEERRALCGVYMYRPPSLLEMAQKQHDTVPTRLMQE